MSGHPHTDKVCRLCSFAQEHGNVLLVGMQAMAEALLEKYGPGLKPVGLLIVLADGTRLSVLSVPPAGAPEGSTKEEREALVEDYEKILVDGVTDMVRAARKSMLGAK